MIFLLDFLLRVAGVRSDSNVHSEIVILKVFYNRATTFTSLSNTVICLRVEDPTFFSTDPDSTLIRNEEKNIFIFQVGGIKCDIINHHSMLEFVDSGLIFVQDKNNFRNPLFKVGSSGPKINGSGSSSLLFSLSYTYSLFPLSLGTQDQQRR